MTKKLLPNNILTNKAQINITLTGGLCMLGGIYSRERCPLCGHLLNFPVRKGLSCPNHPNVKASRLFVKFKKTFLNFTNFEAAEQCLNGLRWNVYRRVYDPRDYQKNNPLGFTNLYKQFWADKTITSTNRQGETERKIKAGSIKNYKKYGEVFCNYFQNTNIKEIAENESMISDCLNKLTTIGNKTKWNYSSHLNDFFTWVWKKNRKSFAVAGIPQPELPVIKYTLKRRKTVSGDVQFEILEEVKRISYHINPKIYLGIKWLCTYPKVRPHEMLSLKEGDINLYTGHLIFPNPKENKWKEVPLIQEDIEILNTFPLSMPNMSFFRHTGGIKGTKANQPFGEKYFYKWWIAACDNLGIKGVDLYAGTKHSTVNKLKRKYSAEEIQRRGTGHVSKAFYRYLETDDEESRALYVDAVPRKRSATVLQPNKNRGKFGKLLKLKG